MTAIEPSSFTGDTNFLSRYVDAVFTLQGEAQSFLFFDELRSGDLPFSGFSIIFEITLGGPLWDEENAMRQYAWLDFHGGCWHLVTSYTHDSDRK